MGRLPGRSSYGRPPLSEGENATAVGRTSRRWATSWRETSSQVKNLAFTSSRMERAVPSYRHALGLAVERMRSVERLVDRFDYSKTYSPATFTQRMFGIIEVDAMAPRSSA